MPAVGRHSRCHGTARHKTTVAAAVGKKDEEDRHRSVGIELLLHLRSECVYKLPVVKIFLSQPLDLSHHPFYILSRLFEIKLILRVRIIFEPKNLVAVSLFPFKVFFELFYTVYVGVWFIVIHLDLNTVPKILQPRAVGTPSPLRCFETHAGE
jgi:hypothetical protein